MRQTLTVSLPENLKRELDKAAAADGVSRSDVIRESLREYLFIRRFRTLRRKMMVRAQAAGVFTDQDVFDRVS